MKLRALFFVAPRRVEVREFDSAATLEDGEILVRTEYSGISAGTEMVVFRGELDPEMVLDETIGSLEGTFRYPFQYGYSCVGRVERSRGSLAEGSLVVALHPHQDWFILPASEVTGLGEGQDPRAATMFPLVETALQIVLDAGTLVGELVVVLGLGVVGILTAALLQRSGASVIAAEPKEWRRAAAAAFGVEAVVPDELGDVVEARTDGRGVPLIVEVSGQPAALAAGLGLLAHEGCALVASWYGTKPVFLPLGGDFHRRRLTVRSTQVSSIPAGLSHRWTVGRRRTLARTLLEELPLTRLASHEFPLQAAQDAFDCVDRNGKGLLHAALCYG